MKLGSCKFYKSIFTAMVICIAGSSFGAQAPNPRSVGTSTRTTTAATGGTTVTARDGGQSVSARSSNSTVSRSATQRPSSTVSRSATTTQKVVNTGRSATTRQNVVSAGGTTARTASTNNVVRSATANTARAGTVSSVVGSPRGTSTARATAVFNDISKIGGGYAECREAYATCMDQFCANANDTYRRCFCSSKYTDFRNTEDALNEAIDLLAQFENNNLTAVGLSAEEVSAMYSATEGEQAIKKDTSAAAQMLEEISDLLSGNKETTTTSNSNASLGIISVDFTSNMDDIWSGTGDSIFDTVNSGVDLSTLEGESLYNQAHSQCIKLITDSCENNAVLTMAKSAYAIMITQDCNIYEKKINSQKETVAQTVRTAEKYLREARLEEYRAHNSADVNECIAKVKSAITSDSVCGANYKMCLDLGTGAYINSTTGEVIYSERLFKLQDLITLNGTSDDVLAQNSSVSTYLDSKRKFAESALDTCRDISDIVWEEFKRQALIEIAQAQDEKIEEAKMSCVSVIAECYDIQAGELKDLDTTTAQYSGAISASAAKEMCKDKVIACASLYGNTEGCEFDGNGHLTVGNYSGASANEMCGLTALLNFVETVDSTRIAEGCSVAIQNYVVDLCTPTTGIRTYPWNCKDKKLGSLDDSESASYSASLIANVKYFALENCGIATGSETFGELPVSVQRDVENIVNNLSEEMDYMLMDICEDLDGYWVDSGATGTYLSEFYKDVYGGNTNNNWGKCVENTTMVRCLDYNDSDRDPVATYNSNRDECVFTDEWYKERCGYLGGIYNNSICYAPGD